MKHNNLRISTPFFTDWLWTETMDQVWTVVKGEGHQLPGAYGGILKDWWREDIDGEIASVDNWTNPSNFP